MIMIKISTILQKDQDLMKMLVCEIALYPAYTNTYGMYIHAQTFLEKKIYFLDRLHGKFHPCSYPPTKRTRYCINLFKSV